MKIQSLPPEKARSWYEHLLGDLRYATRTLHKNLGFTLIVVATLALGIGVNTSIFSIVNGALLKPLPFYEPSRLYVVYEKTAASQRMSVPYLNFLDWQRSSQAFSSFAAFRKDNMILTGEGRPERLHSSMISAGFLATLGVKPVIGREFRPEEDQLGAGGIALISETFWRKRFAANPNVLGTALRLDSRAYTIIGVVPRAVEALKLPLFSAGDVYIPVGQWRDPSFRERSVTTGLCVVARLAPGQTESAGRAEITQIAANLAAEFPAANHASGINLVPLREQLVASLEPTLLVLLFTVSSVLLIACTNVANLLLARSAGRMKEFATRAALGASSWRVITQLLTESIFLGLLGGAAGLLIAALGTRVALSMVPGEIPQADSIGIDKHVLLFTLVISVLGGVFFGLAPIVKIRRLNLSDTLREGGRGSSGLRHRAQSVFVVIEAALALVLLVGAGLMIRSLVKLWSAHPGFDPRNVLVFDITPSPDTAADAQKIRTLFRLLTDKLETVPGVESSSMVLDPMPLTGVADVVAFDVVGRPAPADPKNRTSAIWYFVGPDYFRAMGIALKRGRAFGKTDNENSPQVAVIDEAFARTMFPNEDPIGKRITISYTGASEIIGIVSHVSHWGLGGDPPTFVQRQMYFPYAQLADKYLPLGISGGATVVVRAQSEPSGFLNSVQDQAAQLDSGLALFGVRTVDEIVASWLATRRFTMILLAVFAALALVLAAIGIYGVISYIVGQRTHEIGIRLALGAEPGDILRLILRQGGKLALLGIGLGAIAALLLARLMSGLLFGVGAADPVTLVAAAALLLLVALGACYFPARRAMRVDPLISLRFE